MEDPHLHNHPGPLSGDPVGGQNYQGHLHRLPHDGEWIERKKEKRIERKKIEKERERENKEKKIERKIERKKKVKTYS